MNFAIDVLALTEENTFYFQLDIGIIQIVSLYSISIRETEPCNRFLLFILLLLVTF